MKTMVLVDEVYRDLDKKMLDVLTVSFEGLSDCKYSDAINGINKAAGILDSVNLVGALDLDDKLIILDQLTACSMRILKEEFDLIFDRKIDFYEERE